MNPLEEHKVKENGDKVVKKVHVEHYFLSKACKLKKNTSHKRSFSVKKAFLMFLVLK
jgi:hypothetical protein